MRYNDPTGSTTAIAGEGGLPNLSLVTSDGGNNGGIVTGSTQSTQTGSIGNTGPGPIASAILGFFSLFNNNGQVQSSYVNYNLIEAELDGDPGLGGRIANFFGWLAGKISSNNPGSPQAISGGHSGSNSSGRGGQSLLQGYNHGYRPGTGEIKSYYGERTSPFDETITEFHPGVDLRVGDGNAYSPYKAIVTRSGWIKGYGYSVVVQFTNGPYKGQGGFFGHLKALGLSVGTHVDAGQKVGDIGSTGRSTGPHLHYMHFPDLMNPETIDPLTLDYFK